jgi:hypothetical protein
LLAFEAPPTSAVPALDVDPDVPAVSSDVGPVDVVLLPPPPA